MGGAAPKTMIRSSGRSRWVVVGDALRSVSMCAMSGAGGCEASAVLCYTEVQDGVSPWIGVNTTFRTTLQKVSITFKTGVHESDTASISRPYYHLMVATS